MTTSTESTTGIQDAIYDRLTTFVDDGETLADRLAGGLVWDAPGDAQEFRYGIMRMINRIPSANDSVVWDKFDLEIMLFADNRRDASELETDADICDMAMNKYRDSSSGFMRSRKDRQRDTLPPNPDPASREIVQIRLVYPMSVVPLYLNR